MPPPWRLAVNSSRRPNIENLRKQAKTLLRDWQQGDSAAKERVAAIKPDTSDVSLQSVQFVLAREYGFRSWTALVDFAPNLGHFDDIATFHIAREIDVEPARLWHALSTTTAIEKWLLPVSFEPEVGSAYAFSTNPPMTGTLGEFSPESAIRFDGGDGAYWRFAMEPLSDNAARMCVTVEDKMTKESMVQYPEGVNKVWNPGVTAGWHEILDALDRHLTGRQPPDIDYSCLCKFYDSVLEDVSDR